MRVVVVFPKIKSGSAWSQVLSVRDRFDPLAKRVAPHLTLVHPFTDGMSDGTLEGYVQAVAESVNEFAVNLQGVTLHEGEYLFLNAQRGGAELVNLRNKLYEGMLAPHHDRGHRFVPHMTIGRISPGQVRDALDAIVPLTSEIDGRADAISVYRIDADGHRPVLFEVALK